MRIIILLIAIASTAAAQYVTPVVNTNNGHSKPSALERRFTAVEGMSTKIETAWQNPASATNWLWTSDGKEITLTNYNFASLAVVIPDMLDGLPVTGFGVIFSPAQAGTAITSVSGGRNVTTIGNSAFDTCSSLTSVSLPQATTIGISAFDACSSLTSVSLPQATIIGNGAFYNCTNLTSVSLPQATTIETFAFSYCSSLTSVSLPQATIIGNGAFYNCTNLTSVSLPQATTIENGAFTDCSSLTSVSFAQNAPAEAASVYASSPSVTNFVTNPTAKNWGATWNGMPVVRLDMYGNVIGNATTATTVTGSQSNLMVTAIQTELDPTALPLLTTHTNRTDNPHSVTASQVGALTASETTNLVASQASANFVVRLTTNKTTAYTFVPTNATYVGDCSGSALAPNSVISVLAGNVNDYVFAWGCTNSTFTTIQGTYINYEFFCREADTGDQTYKLEIYRRDIATDALSEWGDGGTTFTVPTTATPTIISGSVYVPSVATNAFRVWARLKRMGGSATNLRTLFIGTGTGTPTFFSMTVPASVPLDNHNADPAAHPSHLNATTGAHPASAIAVTFTPTNYTASAQNVEAHLGGIDASMSAPYKTFTGTITPANGTATVVYAHGNMPSLTITSATTITLDPTSYGTSGVSRVSLNFYSGTNAVTLATNVITYATTPTLSTNCWNTILIRRVSNCVWKGVQL